MILTSLLLSFQISKGQTEVNKESLKNLLKEYLEHDSPGIAAGIVHNGKVVFEEYLGYANLEHQVKIDTNTRFNIASNAKQFTALCIMKLKEDGKLKLEDDFRRYLPEFFPNIEDSIRIVDLLVHQSGIRDCYELWNLEGQTWWKRFLDNDDALKLLRKQSDLNFRPGTDYLYSNSNYILLAALVEEISGISFSDYSQSVFSSLGLSDTYFLSNYQEVIPFKARPYSKWGTWKEYPSLGEINGDGNLYSTLRDQLKWECLLQNSKSIEHFGTSITKSQQIISASKTDKYGYGVMFTEYGSQKCIYHDGSTGAYHSTFVRFPEFNTSIVIMTNNGGVPTNSIAGRIADSILPLVFKSKTYSTVPDQIDYNLSAKDILGFYLQEGTQTEFIQIVVEGDSLFTRAYNKASSAIIQQEGAWYRYVKEGDPSLVFNKEKNDEIGLSLLSKDRSPVNYKKQPDFTCDSLYAKALRGEYINYETGAKINLNYLGNDSFEFQRNGRKREGTLVYRDILKRYVYQYQIVRNQDNKVLGFYLSGNRIKKVYFERLK